MLRVACRSPKTNAELITGEGLKILGHSVTNPVLNSFGLTVRGEMEAVSARVLQSPSVVYKARKLVIAPNTASWNLKGVRFAQGGILKNWAVLVIKDSGSSDYNSIAETVPTVEMFVKTLRDAGVNVNSPQPFRTEPCMLPKTQGDPLRNSAGEAIKAAISRICDASSTKPGFLLVLLSNDNKNVYNHIRTLLDCRFDIPAICCRSNKIRDPKGQMQYFGNISLKANLKLGGRNHEVQGNGIAFLAKEPTLVLGADVTHPTAKVSTKHTPSIAAVVGSYEPSYSL